MQMSTFGDPGFAFHVGMGQYLALLAYHLSSDDLISFDLPNYATQMNSYYNDLLVTINSTQLQLDTTELRAALDEFESRTQEVKALESQAVTTGDTALLEVVNRKYRDFQRGFVSQGGLPTREFYKHVVFAPGIDTGTYTYLVIPRAWPFRLPVTSHRLLIGFSHQATLQSLIRVLLKRCRLVT